MGKLFNKQDQEPQLGILFAEKGLWGKLKEWGAEIQRVVGQFVEPEQPAPVPIPVKVEK